MHPSSAFKSPQKRCVPFNFASQASSYFLPLQNSAPSLSNAGIAVPTIIRNYSNRRIIFHQ